MIRTKWKEKKYAEAISLGINYRNTLHGKGIPALDYIILSSICMLPDKREEGCMLSTIILNDYYTNMNYNDLELLQTSFNSICNKNTEPDNSIVDKLKTKQFTHSRRSSSISGRFKTYYLISESLKKQNISRLETNEIADIIESSIQKKDTASSLSIDYIDNLFKRRVKRGDTLVIKSLAKRFGNLSKYSLSNNFIVIASKGSTINTKTICKHMEKVLNFYISYFSFPVLDDLIVIYLTDNYLQVKPFAKKLYNTSITFNPLGYSNFYDNSILAWIKNDNSVGTLKHELIHILLKSKFSSIPEWFEEGLASLYEESVFNDSSTLIGKNNWRLLSLKRNPFNYTLSDLINNNEYNFTEYDIYRTKEYFERVIEKSSYSDKFLRDLYRDHHRELDEVLSVFLVNHFNLYKDALSRNFLLFLQENKKIKPVYEALMKREVDLFSFVNFKTTAQIIEAAFDGRSIDDVYYDFFTWISKQSVK